MKKIIFLVLASILPLKNYGQTFNGASGPIIERTNYSYCNSGNEFAVNVSGINSNMRLKNLQFNITHQRTYEIYIKLIAPNGTIIPIIDQRGAGPNFIYTTMSYDGLYDIYYANAPFSDIYQGFFEKLNGVDLNGTWKLLVCDTNIDSYAGTLDNWSLTFFTPTELADYADLETPTVSITHGGNAIVYGKVGEAGITDIATDSNTEMEAWVGYSTTNTNPNSWTNWIPATFNQSIGSNDQYKAILNVRLPVGTYYYAMRYKPKSAFYYTYGATNGGTWDGVTHNNGQLTVTTAVTPVNDEPCNAIPLIPNPDYSCGQTVNGTTAGATVSSVNAQFCDPTYKDVWFSFVATATSHFINQVRQAPDSGSLLYRSIWTGPDCNSLSMLPTSCSQIPNLVSGLTIGQTYYLRLTHQSSSAVSFDICLGVAPTAPELVTVSPPTATKAPLDNITIYGQIHKSGVTDFYTTGRAPGISAWIGRSNSNTNPNTSSWYWIPADFNRQVGDNDEYKAVFGPLSPGTYYYATRYQLTFTPQYYYGGVDSNGIGGFWDGTTYKNGILTVTPSTPPVNDNCVNAIPLTVGNYFLEHAVAGNNYGATNTTNTTLNCNQFTNPYNSPIYYSAIVPSSGRLLIESHYRYDSSLAHATVTYVGSSCGSLTETSCGYNSYYGYTQYDINGDNGVYMMIEKKFVDDQPPGTLIYIAVYSHGPNLSNLNASSNPFQISAYWHPSLNIEQQEMNHLKYFPNPVDDFLTLSNDQTIDKVEIFNLLGQHLTTFNINSSEAQIDLSNFSKGIYLINVFSDRQSKTLKIVKK